MWSQMVMLPELLSVRTISRSTLRREKKLLSLDHIHLYCATFVLKNQ